MRYLIIFALLYLVYYVLKKTLFPLRRQVKIFKDYRRGASDKELVQDPHCHTYIPKETAIKATIDGEIHHFCSRECLEGFEKGS